MIYLKKSGILTAIFLSAALIITSLSSFTKGLPASEKKARQNYTSIEKMNSPVEDTTPFAKVIIYRPDNQLSRKYKVSNNTNGAFEIAKKEIRTIETNSNVFIISVDAAGHKKESYTFNLEKNKTHYFRIQDRNNYSGFRTFLEVIEVTEETFKREIF